MFWPMPKMGTSGSRSTSTRTSWPWPSHKGLCGIILVQGRHPEKDTVAKAEEEGIPIMVSSLSAFELVGRLYKAGIRGAEAD